MTDNPDNPLLMSDPLGRPPLREGGEDQPVVIVLPGGSTSPRKLMLNAQRVTRVLDTLIEAKLSQEQAGIMDSDFAAGYVTALEEVKVLLQLDRPSIR